MGPNFPYSNIFFFLNSSGCESIVLFLFSGAFMFMFIIGEEGIFLSSATLWFGFWYGFGGTTGYFLFYGW